MIGVIADDLTGAAEIGAVGLRHGLRAEVVVRGQPGGKADLVCIDTASRSLPANEAAQRVAAATRILVAAGAKWIFKKTDSVLRGQVTAEIEAMLTELGSSRALLLPANPSLGRTIRHGRYLIHGKPINRTDFARDPEHPRRSALVRQLPEPSGKFPVRVLSRDAKFGRAGIFIGEVANSKQLAHWITRLKPDLLLAGGAECFGAALRARGFTPKPARKVAATVASGRELFVCGSASDACRKFVNQAQRSGTPVFALPSELAWSCDFSPMAAAAIAKRASAALKTERRVILHPGRPQIPERAAAQCLTAHLVQLAVRVLAKGSVARVFAEGGETAAVLVREMGWQRFAVKRELAPGVATLAPATGKIKSLTIKPGSYSWPTAVLDPLRHKHRPG